MSKRRGRAYDRAHQRYHRLTPKVMSSARGKFWSDWGWIWADRTRRGMKRSWVQRLLRW